MYKTPITVLQELMTKYMEVPSYECIAQSGPPHMTTFEYRCVAHGVTVHATARSKKEAKHEVARRALSALAAQGVRVPPPYSTPVPAAPDAPAAPAATTTRDAPLPLPPSSGPEGGAAGAGSAGAVGGVAVRVDARSSVALLKELCESYGLGAVEYTLVSDTGPPHLRQFSVRAALSGVSRVASASTKKAARQLAAEQLYVYLREHLAASTKDFVEKCKADPLVERSEQCSHKEAVPERPRKRKSTDVSEETERKRSCDVSALGDTIVKEKEEALSRALDKAMARYVELRDEQPWRPDLGQRIADYHLGVFTHISEEQRVAAESAAEARQGADEDCAKILMSTAEALGMTVELSTLPADGGELSVVTLGPAAPTMVLAGATPAAASRAALRYLRRALRQRPANPAPIATI